MWKVTHLTHLSYPYTAVRISSQTRQRLLWEVTRFKHYSKPSEISIPQSPLDARQRLLWKVTHFEHYSKPIANFNTAVRISCRINLPTTCRAFRMNLLKIGSSFQSSLNPRLTYKRKPLVIGSSSELAESPIELQTQTSSDRKLFSGLVEPPTDPQTQTSSYRGSFRSSLNPD